jgi:CHAT domain-containing protein
MAGGTPEEERTSEPAEEVVLALRGERSGCGVVSNILVSPLPGSEAEVKDIASLVQGEGWREVDVITGAGATEDHLKRYAPGHRIVHLATHGFYLNGVCESALSWRTASPATDEKRGYMGENPMLLSGLLVSGSNRHGEGTEEIGIDDGILTATELASVDLSGCDWLVLSACETALGEVEQGEGVFGLRRAAQLAGARTVIMSVFPVPDKETRELMTVLYRERLAGRSTVESLQQAMRAMMARAEEKSGSRHPVYWGGFVAAGGWD